MNVSQNTVEPVKTTDSCLVCCIPPYTPPKCDSCDNDVPRATIIDQHTIAPWVEVIILPPEGEKGPPFILTVGNQSFPDPDPGLRHSAVIKDFEYGTSDGAGCRFTVHDQLGSPFVTFMRRINKRFHKVSSDYTMRIRFGWVGTDCNGKHVEIKSHVVSFLPISVENTYNDGGKVVYTIDGTDMLIPMAQSRVDKAYGKSGAEMTLKDAIIKLFKEDPEPSVIAKFLRQKCIGEPEPWDFQGNTTAVWRSSGKSKLEAAMDWIKPHLTDKGRGIYYSWDTSDDKPAIIFWESPHDNKGVESACCLKHYVVNGGKCSPVVSFSPKAKWNYSKIMNQTGGIMGVGGQQAVKAKGQEGQEKEVGAGIQIYGVSSNRDSVLSTYGFGSEVNNKVIGAELENCRKYFPFRESVSAELVIQGDPSPEYVYSPGWQGKTLAITVINPFHLLPDTSPSGTDQNAFAICPVWLAAPACNPVFTSSMWFINKISHSIKAGSYLTTIGLELWIPGVDISEEQVNPAEKDNPVNQG